MPKVATILCDDGQGQKSVSLLLTRDALFLDPDGIPSPGIGLSASQARALADRLLLLASQVEGEERPGCVVTGAILVIHDGTPRGGRAFALGLTMARDSHAPLFLHVRDEAAWNSSGDVIDQCTRQLSALQDLAIRCAAEAAREGVRLKPYTITIGGREESLAPSGADIDFLIMPRPAASSEPVLFSMNIGRYMILVQ